MSYSNDRWSPPRNSSIHAAPRLPPKHALIIPPPLPPKIPTGYTNEPGDLSELTMRSDGYDLKKSRSESYRPRAHGMPPKLHPRRNDIAVSQFQDRRPEFHPLGPRGPDSGITGSHSHSNFHSMDYQTDEVGPLHRSQTYSPSLSSYKNEYQQKNDRELGLRRSPRNAIDYDPFFVPKGPKKHVLPPLPEFYQAADNFPDHYHHEENDNINNQSYDSYDADLSPSVSVDRTNSTYTTRSTVSIDNNDYYKQYNDIKPDTYNNGVLSYERPIEVPYTTGAQFNEAAALDNSDLPFDSEEQDHEHMHGEYDTGLGDFSSNAQKDLSIVSQLNTEPPRPPVHRASSDWLGSSPHRSIDMEVQRSPNGIDRSPARSPLKLDTAANDPPTCENTYSYPYSPPMTSSTYNYDGDVYQSHYEESTDVPMPVIHHPHNSAIVPNAPSYNRRYSEHSLVGAYSVNNLVNDFNTTQIKLDVTIPVGRTQSDLNIRRTALDSRRISVPAVPLKDRQFLNNSVISEVSLDPALESSMRSSGRSDDFALMHQLGLPSIPQTKPVFSAAKISTKDYNKCNRIWSLNQTSFWIYSLFREDMDMPFKELTKALTGLFTHYISTLNWLHAEKIAENSLESMTKSGFITASAGLVLSFDLSLLPTGVLPQLTGHGCYSMSHAIDVDENYTTKHRCYSSRCSLTLPVKHYVPKAELTKPSNSDWAAFYEIPTETLDDLEKRELRHQYTIHELITGEESYVRDLDTLLSVFGESLAKQIPPVMKNQRQFCQKTFGSIRSLVDVNTKYLLEPFKLRQKSQGPYIDGVADIVLEWVKRAKGPYLNYSGVYLFTDRTLRKEKEHNTQFANWFERASKDPRTNGTPHSFFFHRAIPRLARYGLLLGAIKKLTLESSPEWELLERAIVECNQLTSQCNKSLANTEKVVELVDFKEKLQFKGPEEVADLKLKDPQRKIVRRGDVVRRGDYRLEWVDSHLFLLDNYLILSKIKNGVNGQVYYITKKPIPLDLLVLDSVSGDPVTKSSKLGVGTFTSHATPAESKRSSRLYGISPTKGDSGSSVTAIEESEKEVLYPFKITHLGRAGTSYTMYASSKFEREQWEKSIVQAKREYGSAIYTMNAEPFKLKVLSEYSFAYESGHAPKLPIFVQGTAVDRGMAESPERCIGSEPPGAIFRSRINCSTSFVFADGREYTIIGMDYGAFIYESKSPSTGWTRCLELTKITQIDTIPDFNVLLVLSDKSLSYFDLDAVIIRALRGGEKQKVPLPIGVETTSSIKIMPQGAISGYKLSKVRDVGYFTTGRLKGRVIVMYKQRESVSSVLKVIEPVKEKGQLSRRSKMVFARGATVDSTEYFRGNERLYIPSESYGVNLFKQTFAVASSKGFEILSLDMRIPQSVPVISSINPTIISQLNKTGPKRIKALTVDILRKRIEQCKPVAMFRISDKKLVLCYDEMILYMDNNGNLAGPCVVDLICKARHAAYQHPYLLAFDEEMVEIRRVDRELQLRQVISGKDIRVLEKKEGQIKIGLAHPREAGRQLVVEVVGNEFVVEDDSSSLAAL